MIREKIWRYLDDFDREGIGFCPPTPLYPPGKYALQLIIEGVKGGH